MSERLTVIKEAKEIQRMGVFYLSGVRQIEPQISSFVLLIISVFNVIDVKKIVKSLIDIEPLFPMQ